jgi:hypothetical protein
VVVAAGSPFVVFKAVAAKEELADVPSNIVVQQKLTAWVLIDEFLHINNKVINNY